MLSTETLHFLTELKQNNNREWFNANKPRYEAVKKEFEKFIHLMINKISNFDNQVAGLLPKNCIFRIYRDIRFSHDKTPYKPNLGAFMAKGGRKSNYAGYYLHIEANGSFLAGGLYNPPSDVLREVRTEIMHRTNEFKEIINNQNFKKYFEEIKGDKLKLAPKGFPKDFDEIELLKFKSYTVIHNLTNEQVVKNDFADYATQVFREMYRLNGFFNRIIE